MCPRMTIIDQSLMELAAVHKQKKQQLKDAKQGRGRIGTGLQRDPVPRAFCPVLGPESEFSLKFIIWVQ